MVRDLGYVGLLAVVFFLATAACSAGPQTRPQVSVSPSGERYPPLTDKAPVKVHFSGEPNESFREIGRVTSTCPERHWVRGQEKSGRRLCVAGLREGARKLGGQAVVDVHTQSTQPEWEPNQTWLVMKAVVVRFLR